MEKVDSEEESYVKHLQDMFNELDAAGKGGLNRKELRTLSERLSLVKEQSDILEDLVFSNENEVDSNECVSFGKFQESFVEILSTTTDLFPGSDDDGDEEPVKDVDLVNEKINDDQNFKDLEGQRENSVEYDCEELEKSDLFTTTLEEIPLEPGRAKEMDLIVFDGEEYSSEDEDSDAGFYKLPDKNRSKSEVYFESNGELRHEQSAPRLKQSSISSSNFSQPNHLFTDLDRDKEGIVDYLELCEMWKKEGIPDPKRILEILEISFDSENCLNAYDLTAALQNETTSNSGTINSVVQALLATYKRHITCLNEQIEQHHILLGMIKDDLEKSEVRNSVLVDEVDDRYFSIDRRKEQILKESEDRWGKKLRQEKINHKADQEILETQIMREKDVLQQEIERLVMREDSLRRTIEALQIDNDALELENKDVLDKLKLTENKAGRLQKDLECLLNEKTSSMNDPMNGSQDEKFAFIIKEYEAQCRTLSDRNDELVAEVEEMRSKFLLAMKTTGGENGKNQPISSEMVGSEQSAKLTKHIADLESAIEDLKQENSTIVKKFDEEKNSLQMQIEVEYQDKLDEEKRKLINFQETMKSDKNTAINQALADGRKQREELERKNQDIEKQLTSERKMQQDAMSSICREFEKDKSELQSKHDSEKRDLIQKIEDLEHQVEKERQTHEITAEQLRNERDQHDATLRTHSDTVKKMEIRTKQIQEEGSDTIACANSELQDLKEVVSSQEKNIEMLSMEHKKELQSIKDEMQMKLEEIAAEKQQKDLVSLCSNLENLQDDVMGERSSMQSRLSELRNSFNAEAEELRTLVEMEKNKIRKQLNEEVVTLRKKLAEETQRELDRKRRLMEEGLRSEQNAHIRNLEETIRNLKKNKIDLEEQLAFSLRENEKLTRAERSKASEDEYAAQILQLRAEIHEKSQTNEIMLSQLEGLREKQNESEYELTTLKSNSDVKNAEISQLSSENQHLLNKLLTLESENSSHKVANARLNSKNIDLEKMVPRLHDSEMLIKEKEMQISKLEAEIKEKEAECSHLQSAVELEKKSRRKHDRISKSAKISSEPDVTKQQLIQQMKKTKDLLSRLAKSETLIKNLYCENAQLLQTVRVSEEKQKVTEQQNIVVTDKNLALQSLLSKVCRNCII